MNGKEVFRHAVGKLANVIDETLTTHALGVDDIDWLIPHQANRRIIDNLTAKLGLPVERGGLRD